jgi:hypothetical protein
MLSTLQPESSSHNTAIVRELPVAAFGDGR